MKKIKKLEGFAKEGLKFEIPYLRYGSIDIDEEEDKYTFGQEGYNRSLIAKDKKKNIKYKNYKAHQLLVVVEWYQIKLMTLKRV